MKTLFFVVGLILSTAAAANAATCAAATCAVGQAEPCPCEPGTWIPSTPPGWLATYNKWPVALGWIKVCDGSAAADGIPTGNCFRTSVPQGEWTVNQLGDLDVTGASGQWTGHIRFIQVNTTGTDHIYDNASCFGGSFVAAGTGLWTLNFGPGTGSNWDPSCMKLRTL